MIVVFKIISVIITSILCGIFSANVKSEYYNVLENDSEKVSMKSLVKQVYFRGTAIFSSIFIVFSALYLFLVRNRDISLMIQVENILVWDLYFLIALIDFQKKKIPNFIIIILLIIRGVFLVIECILSPSNALNLILFSVIGFLVGGFIILACMLISRGGVGSGDMKLFAVSGLFFGLPGVMVIMMYSLFLAAITSVVLLLARKAKMKSTLAMAPFIFLGLSLYLIFSF